MSGVDTDDGAFWKVAGMDGFQQRSIPADADDQLCILGIFSGYGVSAIHKFFRQIRLGFQGKLAAVGKYVDKFFLHDLVPCNIYAHTMQVLQQRFEFIQQLIECFHGLLYRKRRTHVHAGDLQQGDGVGGAAAGEEFQIVLHGLLSAGEDPSGQGHGGGKAGGVLVDVEAAVEVGDAAPLHLDLPVKHHILAVVEPVEIIVDLAQALGGQGLAALRKLVDLQLELREHGLAVQRGAELLQEIVDEHRPLLLVAGLFQQVLHQQGLVAGRGHLRHEEDVLGVDRGLVLRAEVGVHGVAHLVGQGELAVEVVLVVEQDEGVDRAADGVGAGALALVFIDIHPPLVKAALQDLAVLLAQHSGGLQHLLPGLGEGDLLVGLGEHGGVDIVHVQLVQAHGLLPQGHVAVHLVHVLVDGLDEIVVHRHRHLHRGQGALQGAVVLSGPGEEDVLAHLRVEHGGQGVAAAAKDAVEGPEGVLPQYPVPALHEGDIGTVGQGVLLPLAVCHGGEAHVGVVEGVEDAARPLTHLAGRGQQVLLGGGEDVVLLQPGLVQVPAELLQFRLLPVEPLQIPVGDSHQFRALKGNGAAELDHEAEAAALHGLVDRVGGVLVVFDERIDKQFFHLLVCLLGPGQVVVEGLGALAQAAPVGRGLIGQPLAGPEPGLPRFVCGIEVGGVPAGGRVHLAPLENLHILRHRVPPYFVSASAAARRSDTLYDSTLFPRAQ